jgi:hypothetical protein
MSDVPKARQCTFPSCTNEAVDDRGEGGLCETHIPGKTDAHTPEEPETPDENPTLDTDKPGSADGYDPDAFTSPDERTWPTNWATEERWMCRIPEQKHSFAPWGDRNHPEGEEDKDARYKWGLKDNYADLETARKWNDKHPRTGGVAFHLVEKENDPWAFVDGDDVRCPETDEVHPAFIELLERLGVTYCDISTSGTGVHAAFAGDLPDGVKTAEWELDDEPWGENDDLPAVEIYDHKHVCIATGEHVPGTPTEAREWDDDALWELLEENDQLPRARPGDETHESFDLDDYEPTTTDSDEATDDIRDVLAALDRLDARAVAEDTIVQKWNDRASTSDGKRAFWPTWGSTNDNGTANVVDRRIWQDTGHRGGYGTPVVMALIDLGELSDRGVSPRDATGELWWKGVEHLRDLGYPIPEYESPDGGKEPVSALPVNRLQALNPEERQRAARKRGLEWPTTSEARTRLRDRIMTAMRHRENVVIDAPTALGKTHTVATEPWLNHLDVTDEQPVIHFSETREARDEAADKSRNASGVTAVLKGRKERCPVAAGDHDPADDGDEEPDVTVTMNGAPASSWLDEVCDVRGVPFSTAHAHLAEHNDQGHDDLPCCEDDAECPAKTQWNGVPRDEDGHATADVVHATHQFAYVPSLVSNTNIVFDERPDFTLDVTNDRVQRAVSAFLKAAGAPATTWEAFVQLAQHDAMRGDAADERDATEAKLDYDPGRDWYLTENNAHTYAPALAKAIWYALRQDSDVNGRRSATVPHEPPRLDGEANDSDGWNRQWVSVVLDDDNRVQTARASPDFSPARCVIGLDAHPAEPLWQRNVSPDITTDRVLEPDERRLWRRFERGLTVVQVGDATRPLSSGEYFDEDGTRALVEQLRENYGDEFNTAITAASVESRTKQILDDVGVNDPETMHYGEEKSRDDFGNEGVGFVNGCIDPGDDYVLNLLAEAGLDARPETTEGDDGEERRAHGRGFVGEDAETAAAILASVRENHTAQAAGRYARNADDPADTATVFVRTDALPAGYADLQVPGVEWVPSDLQREIIEELRDRDRATAREIQDAVGCSKEHVADTLNRLADADKVRVREGVGDYGADVYRDDDTGVNGVVSLDGVSITNTTVWGSYTWEFVIREEDAPDTDPASGFSRGSSSMDGTTDDGGGGLDEFNAD